MKHALQDIAKDLKDNPDYQHLPLSVRSLLHLFHAERRGFWVVKEISNALTSLGIETEPNFENTWIDSPIRIRLIPKPAKQPSTQTSKKTDVDSTAAVQSDEDPTFRIGRLQAVSRSVVSVKPDNTVQMAATLMMQNQFSQLPVTTNVNTIKGVISWASLGASLALGKVSAKVGDCMTKHYEVREDASLFEAMPGIIEHGYVLIRRGDNQIGGILTVGGLSLEFRQLTETFLLLQEIEKYLRKILERVPKQEFLDKAKMILIASAEGETSSDIAEMSLGDYLRLLENPAFWDLLTLKLDRNAFVQELHKVRRIRNSIMHFDQDGLKEEDRQCLRNSSAFFQTLNELLL